MNNNDPAWYEALFRGIDSVLSYYEPVIHGLAFKFQDQSRATLNHDDLCQICRSAIVRAWKSQCRKTDIKNFDIYAKWAMENSLRTETSKEFCESRGRFHLVMLSELAVNSQGEDQDPEAIIHRHRQENTSGLTNVVEHLEEHLIQARHKRIFRQIVHEEEYLAFSAPDKIPKSRFQKLSDTLQTTEHELLQSLEEIQFIFQGYRQNFLGVI
jgi:hypothetical protein